MEDQRGYSQEVREILDRKPRWIIRWGIVLIAGLFGLGLACAWFIPYSDTMNLPVTIRFQQNVPGQMTRAMIQYPRVDSGYFKAGQVLNVIVNGRALNPMKFRSAIREISLDSNGSGCLAKLEIPPRQDSLLTDPTISWPATVQFTTGRSNLLEQIFRPIRNIFLIRRKG